LEERKSQCALYIRFNTFQKYQGIVVDCVVAVVCVVVLLDVVLDIVVVVVIAINVDIDGVVANSVVVVAYVMWMESQQLTMISYILKIHFCLSETNVLGKLNYQSLLRILIY